MHVTKYALYSRHNVEPDVSLRYSAQGLESSSISINNPPQQPSTSSSEHPAAGMSVLPGPRQITTGPGVAGTNPVTGERQRRHGVSGPPSGWISIHSGTKFVKRPFVINPSSHFCT